MRGKDLIADMDNPRKRITPAYAGKSDALATAIADLPDHPRLCGEKHITGRLCADPEGSPPPMRGKACDKRKFRRGIRITPAYAGKSSSRVLNGTFLKDHPRLCGEKVNTVRCN